MDLNCHPCAAAQATAALGPLMYGVVFWLPFVVFGAITVVWMLFMAATFHVRGTQVAGMLNKGSSRARGEQEVPRGLKFYMQQRTFVTAEAMYHEHSREGL